MNRHRYRGRWYVTARAMAAATGIAAMLGLLFGGMVAVYIVARSRPCQACASDAPYKLPPHS